jgi:hypothetical protein
LAKAIKNEYNVSFAMVKGLHRIYTVRNVLEGRLCDDSDYASSEPYTKNKFLQSRIKTRIYILDQFTEEALAHFQELSLFIMKVKKASVERTVYDELSQCVHEIERKGKIVDLSNNQRCFSQMGRYDKDENHVLYNQRLSVYKFFTSFAFNRKKSTVLYKFQSDHLQQVVSSQHIPNKHHYLGLSPTTDLNDKGLFHEVENVIKENVEKKAQEFTTLCTREATRNTCLTTKPLSQEIRIVLSYYVLASSNIGTIKDATDIFSSSYKFIEPQTKRHVNIISTMYKIVLSVDNVVEHFRKSINLTGVEVHTTKICQLLQMNLFNDILNTIKDVGHNPSLPLNVMINIIHNVNVTCQDSSLVELLQGWSITLFQYLKNVNDIALSSMKEAIIKVCMTGDKTKTDVRLGKFGTDTLDKYTLPAILWFSTFVRQVHLGSMNLYRTIAGDCVGKRTRSNDILTTSNEEKKQFVEEGCEETESDDDEGHCNHIDSEREYTDENEIDDDGPEVMPPPPPKRKVGSSMVVNDVTSNLKPTLEMDGEEKNETPKKKRKANASKNWNKKMFDIPAAVYNVYNAVLDKERKTVPINIEINAINEAWMRTVSSIKTGHDLTNMWNIHSVWLFRLLENPMPPAASSVSNEGHVTTAMTASNGSADVTMPASTPSSITFTK